MNRFFYTLILLIWAGLHMSFAQGDQTRKQVIYFEYKSAHLSDLAQSQLKQWIKPIVTEKIDRYTITLTGVADSVGTNANNYDLARLRARNVQAYLANLGISTDRIVLNVLGELPAQNTQEHTQNRRVEATLSWSPPPIAVNPVPVSTKIIKQGDDILDLFKKLTPVAQIFVIDPTQDTLLNGRQGTQILIKAHSFFLRGGSKHSPVKLALRTYYNYTDMLLANLTTTSNHKLLETGGMLHLKATQNGQEIRLKSNREILIGIPTQEVRPHMQAFVGNRDDQGYMNWRLNRRGWVNTQVGGNCVRNKVCWLRRIFSRKARTRYQRARARWKKANQLTEENAKQEAKMIAQNNYIVSSNQLGWINCDAFYNVPRQHLTKVQFKAKKPFKSTRYFVILHQRRSIVAGYPVHYKSNQSEYKLTFGALPKNQSATLVALHYQEEKVMMATKSLAIGKKIYNDLSFQAYPVAQARVALQKLLAKKVLDVGIRQGK